MLNIGVRFEFYQGKRGGVTFESLQGKDLKNVLANLKLSKLLNPRREALIPQLWSDFVLILDLIKKGDRQDSAYIKARAKAWWNLFTTPPTGEPNSRERIEGLYLMTDGTPYIHVFVEHCHQLVALHGGLDPFACDGLEKKGHLVQSFFWRRTMHGGGRHSLSPMQLFLERENRLLKWSRMDQEMQSSSTGMELESDGEAEEPERLANAAKRKRDPVQRNLLYKKIRFE